MSKGQIEPHLKSAVIALTEKSPLTIYSYDRFPDEGLENCMDDVRKYQYATGGSYIFAAGQSVSNPVLAIQGVSDLPHIVSVYKGKGVFMLVSGPKHYELGVRMPFSTKPPSNSGYYAADRCGFQSPPRQ
jgi:hypothetical protein